MLTYEEGVVYSVNRIIRKVEVKTYRDAETTHLGFRKSTPASVALPVRGVRGGGVAVFLRVLFDISHARNRAPSRDVRHLALLPSLIGSCKKAPQQHEYECKCQTKCIYGILSREGGREGRRGKKV